MLFRLFSLLLIGILSVVVQIGLVAVFPAPFSFINVVLIVLFSYFFWSQNIKTSFFLIIWTGFLLELFGPAFFGLSVLSLFLSFLLIVAICNTFLTNKTTVVLATTAFLMFVFYNLIFAFFIFLVNIKYNLGTSYSFLSAFKNGIFAGLVNLPLILLINFFRRKFLGFFKQVFIIR